MSMRAAAADGAVHLSKLAKGRGLDHALDSLSRVMGSAVRRIDAPWGHFQFEVFDPYWSRYAYSLESYEPEMWWLLDRLRGQDWSFIDAGANLGLWSIVASSRNYGARTTVAVEASGSTFTQLMRNRAINNERFEALHLAITDRSGDHVQISDGGHAGRHVVEDLEIGFDSRNADMVRTTTIDDLLDVFDVEDEVDDDEVTVIKLDIEGQEEACIRGLRSWSDRNLLLIYEDHGKDREHLASKAVRSHLDAEIFMVEAGRMVRIDGPHHLDELKRSTRVGYNFVAFSRPSSPTYDRMLTETV